MMMSMVNTMRGGGWRLPEANMPATVVRLLLGLAEETYFVRVAVSASACVHTYGTR